MKYIKLEWPEIQDYMEHPEYDKECYFDPNKNCWFIPEQWTEWLDEKISFEMYESDMIDNWEAVGGNLEE